MNPEDQQRRLPVYVIEYLLVPIICIGFLVMSPFVVVFGIIFTGPLMYYEATMINSNALTAKYSKEGVRLQGKVIKRWKTGEGSDHEPMFHVQVVYRVDQDRYVNNNMVVNRGLYSEQELALVRLLDFPGSAIIFSRVEGVDPDFPPSNLPSIFFAFLWMTIWNIISIVIILNSIEACDFCTNLIGPVFFGMIALELLVGYWVAKRERDSNLKSLLYGAKRVVRQNVDSGADDDYTAADDAPPKYVSYSDLFDEGKHSCFSVIPSIVLDFVVWICFVIYFLFFVGGYMIMYSLVVARWRYNILQRYESESKPVVGSIVCRQGHGNSAVVVQYTVDAQVYKKQLIVPSQMVRSGCVYRHEYGTVPDDPDLLYIMDNPASATLKCQIDNPHNDRKKFRKVFYDGLFYLLVQVYGGLVIQTHVDQPHGTQFYISLAGILLACHIIFGFIGAYIHYEFFFKRDLLRSAKRGVPKSMEGDELLLDEEQELDIAVLLEPGWDELTQTATDESVSTTKTFVDKFVKGNLSV